MLTKERHTEIIHEGHVGNGEEEKGKKEIRNKLQRVRNGYTKLAFGCIYYLFPGTCLFLNIHKYIKTGFERSFQKSTNPTPISQMQEPRHRYLGEVHLTHRYRTCSLERLGLETRSLDFPT